MKVTYNNIIEQLRTFAKSHFQINEFANGDLWEAIEHNQFSDFNYPLLFAVDGGGSTEQGGVNLNFDLLCMDLVDKAEQIENEVKSDTLQILLDVVAYLKKLQDSNWYYVEVSPNSQLSSFTEKLQDELTGWKISVSIRQPFTYNACAIPYNEAQAGVPTIDCLPVTITDSDGVTVVEVASGGTFACTPKPKDLQINLNFANIDNKIKLTVTDENKGQITDVTSTNVGNIEVSNDNTTYTPLTLPLTLTNGVDYYFKRQLLQVSGLIQLKGYADALFNYANSFNDNAVMNGLIQWLRGDTGIAGNVWSDQSGNGNDATLVNSPTINATNIELDGINDYIDLHSGNNLTQFTISITVEYLSLPNDTRLIGELSFNGSYGMTTRAIYNGNMTYFSGIEVWNTLNFTPIINTKYTFDFVADNVANTTLIYINGVLTITIPTGTVFTPIGIGNKYLGLYGNYLNGRVYDFKMYNRALTQAEITQNYNAL